MATTTSTSILNTPQAADDYFTYTETDVLASNSILTLDVMANDSGGKSKTLYSIEASEEFLEALKVKDAAGEANAQYFNGVKVWIDNGKIMVDVSGADALAALGAQSIEDLDAGQQLNLSFAYTIQLGNGTLSVATVSLTITGEGSSQPPDLSTIGGDTTGTATETNATDGGGIEHGVPTGTEGALILNGAAGVTFVAQTGAEGSNHWGTFTIDQSGNWTYTTHDAMDFLAAGETRTDSFVVQATDGATQAVTVTIVGSNDGPRANDDTATIGATQSLTLDVLANDTDPDDGDVLTIVGTPSALYGTVTIVDNKLFYDPGTMFANLEPGQFVDEMLHYTVQDASGATSQATATVYLTSESTDHPIDNITGIDRGAILATITEATTGTIPTISGMVTFTDADVSQPYTVSATSSAYGALTATIAVNASDPTLREITWTFTADTAVIEALGLSASDIEHFLSDPAGFITLDNGLPGGISQIPLVLIVNGADDGEAVEINSPPVMATDVEGFDFSVGFSGTLSEDTATPLSWGAFLMDPDGPDESTFQTTGLERGQYGTFSYDRTAATWSYTLDERAQALGAGESMTEHYDAVSVDGSLGFAINVALTGLNDAPVAGAVTLTPGVEDEARTITAAELLGGTHDVDSASLDITGLTILSGGGTLTDHMNGIWTYTPAENYHGPVTFSYTVSDGIANATGSASLEVTPGTTTIDHPAFGEVILFTDSTLASNQVEMGMTLSGKPMLSDPDGEIVEVHSQWQYLTAEGWQNIGSPDSKQLYLDPTIFSEGNIVRMQVFTTDELGGQSIIDSASLTLIPAVEAPATGTLQLRSDPDIPGTLFVDLRGLKDPNGGIVSSSVQWQAFQDGSWVDIGNGSGSSLNVDDLGLSVVEVRALVTTTDGAGGTTDFTSPTQWVLGANGVLPQGTGTLVETDSLESISGHWVDNPAQIQLLAEFTQVDTKYGTFTVDTYGQWQFDATDAFNVLMAEQHATLTIPLVDIHGNSVEFVVDVVGTNDAAEVSGDTYAVLAETSTRSGSTWTAHGQLWSFDIDADPDLDDSFKASDSRGDLNQGTFGVDGNGAWHFTLDSGVSRPVGEQQGLIDSTTFETADGTRQTVYVTDGAAVVAGTAGDDHLISASASQVLLGGAGDDILSGGSGDDWLYGGAGDDVLSGNLGHNVMTGGDGQDTFFFRNVVAGADSGLDVVNVITDFNVNDDVILLNIASGSDFAAIGSTTADVFNNSVFYDTSTGALNFVPEGGTSLTIAMLDPGLSLSASNFRLTFADETGRASGGGGGPVTD